MKIIIRYGYETKDITKISYKNQKRRIKIYRNFALYDAKEWVKNKEKGDNTEKKKEGGGPSRAARNGT